MDFRTSSSPQLLRTRVYEHLREQLKNENLKPGMFISINQLIENLGLSRTPVRDALLQLQTEGFVTFLPQRGIRINELTAKDIDNIYEMLGGLDSRALLSVFPRIGPDEIDEMKRINEEMHRAIPGEDLNEYFHLNTDFHSVYLNLSTNLELLNHVNILRQRLFEFGKSEIMKKIVELNYREHLTMIQLIEAGKAKEAANYMRDVHCVLDL
ncbi:MAG: GntR family transcriptional regulator [Desulfobacterales bacterium]|nr:GntR family transcriptional regulator [Desulfobacterales bacterium]